jgi:signal transduction histidine kinase
VAIRRHLPPRHLSYLFVGITLALATALVWLGLELVRQDRALEAQRVRDDLQRVAISAAEELSQRLADVENALDQLVRAPAPDRETTLATWGNALGSGAVLVHVTGDSLRAAPFGVLRFDPSFTPGTSLSPAPFASGESLEFRQRDYAGATDAYRALVNSDDIGTRGDALLRLGRVLQKQRDVDGALAAYRQLAALNVQFDDIPAALLAGHASIVLYEGKGRPADARALAEFLATRLRSGAWRLTRSSYEFYAAEVEKRLHRGVDALDEETLLSRAVDSLYRTPVAPGGGRDAVVIDSLSILRIWRATPTARVAFLATPDHVARAWIAPLEPALAREGVTLALADGSGRWILPAPREQALHRVVRSTSETRLPWALSVQSSDPLQRSADLAARRRILLTALVVSLLLVLVGTYAVARAVNRELAVARMQSDFVSAVSHEFRTPLTSLRQVTELLAGGRVSSEERRAQYHDVLARETGRLHRLVENLLDFGRFEAGAHEFRFERVDPFEIVEPLVNEFRQEVGPNGFEVVLEHQRTGAVYADRQAIGLALRNLLDNAVKYSRNERRIDVSVSKPDGRVALSVRDQGIGIPPDEQRAIFDRFTRGRGVRTSGIPGTGIGLAMVRHIVREHGGEVRVASAVGAGSTFTILLKPADS